jgi:hypothetical protein
MRDILRELPKLYQINPISIAETDFIEIIASKYATKSDLKLTDAIKQKIHLFQEKYLKLISILSVKFHINSEFIFLETAMRSSIINKYDRITGDSITLVVRKIISKKKHKNTDELYQILNDFIEYQDLRPNLFKKAFTQKEHRGFVKELIKVVRHNREGL